MPCKICSGMLLQQNISTEVTRDLLGIKWPKYNFSIAGVLKYRSGDWDLDCFHVCDADLLWKFCSPSAFIAFFRKWEFPVRFEVWRSAIRVQADHPLERGDFYDPRVQSENVLRKTSLSAHGWRAGGASSPLFLPVHNEPRQNLIGKDSKKSLEWRVFARIDLPCLYNSVIFLPSLDSEST